MFSQRSVEVNERQNVIVSPPDEGEGILPHYPEFDWLSAQPMSSLHQCTSGDTLIRHETWGTKRNTTTDRHEKTGQNQSPASAPAQAQTSSHRPVHWALRDFSCSVVCTSSSSSSSLRRFRGYLPPVILNSLHSGDLCRARAGQQFCVCADFRSGFGQNCYLMASGLVNLTVGCRFA